MSTDGFDWSDTNNDGMGDVGVGDNNVDGVADSYLTDSNFDGVSDTFAVDADQNGRIEAAMVDSNQDGVFETLVQDTDQDGIIDVSAVDTNEDGVFDIVSSDANHDGVDDSQQQNITNVATVTIGGGTGGYQGPFADLVNSPQFQSDPEFRHQVQGMIQGQQDAIDTILRPSDDPYDPFD